MLSEVFPDAVTVIGSQPSRLADDLTCSLGSDNGDPGLLQPAEPRQQRINEAEQARHGDLVRDTRQSRARLDAVRAHLLEPAGRTDEALAAYRRAIAATVNVAEQRHLRDRLVQPRAIMASSSSLETGTSSRR